MKESSFKFSDPYILSLQYKDNPDFDPDHFDDIKIDFNTQIEMNADQNKARVTVTTKIGDHDSCPFYTEVAMQSCFFWENCYDENMIKELVEKNAVSLLIGYIRPIVAMVTSSSRFPAFNLPFIDLSEDKKND